MDLPSSGTLWYGFLPPGKSVKPQKENMGEMNISLDILNKIRNGQGEEWGRGPLVMRDGHWLPASVSSRNSTAVSLAKGRAKQTVYELCAPSL